MHSILVKCSVDSHKEQCYNYDHHWTTQKTCQDTHVYTKLLTNDCFIPAAPPPPPPTVKKNVFGLSLWLYYNMYTIWNIRFVPKYFENSLLFPKAKSRYSQNYAHKIEIMLQDWFIKVRFRILTTLRVTVLSEYFWSHLLIYIYSIR